MDIEKMPKHYSLSLFIFRRDLRLQDNNGLIAAAASSKQILPCFIFDKRQIENNPYKSDNAIQFMAHSLQELSNALQKKNGKLYFFYGIAEEVIDRLISSHAINAVFINRDYTPFSDHRDQKIEKICHKHAIDFHVFADSLLHEPEEITKSDHHPYSIFTPYFKRASKQPVQSPQAMKATHYFRNKIEFEDKDILEKCLAKKNANLTVKGGRIEALALLKNIARLKDYQKERDIPALSSTTKLSAHNKFGTVSIREVYKKIVDTFGKQHSLIIELYWRDFFTQVAYFYPHVFNHPFHKKYEKLKWKNREKDFRAWRDGMTGFPIVDAGMRELNISGYMHNRVRMITASFLTKDLQIDWRWGEKYFAQKLVDYDPAVNNGNWQWAASTGCDAQPYFRIFNPWLQQKKFDPECLYIKRWVPELARVPNKLIHEWYKAPRLLGTNYPYPIVDHDTQSQQAKMLYKLQNK